MSVKLHQFAFCEAQRHVMKQFIFSCFFYLLSLFVQAQQSPVSVDPGLGVPDTAFWQEYHEGFIVADSEGDNDVRSIAVDASSNVWIATASGVFIKDKNKKYFIKSRRPDQQSTKGA